MHQRYSAALEARVRNWAGVNFKNSRGMIGGRRVVLDPLSPGPFFRYNRFEKQVYFSAYHISPKNVNDYVEGMRKYSIEYLTGYAKSNYLLARMIESQGISVPKLKAVITSSESLTEEMRSILERTYSCKVFNSYSGVECCGLVSECENGSMHVSPDVGIIEILKDNGDKVKPGETGRAICTGFLNFDQPLIRYDIGDRLTLAENQVCGCGRNMPIIAEISGRVEDVITGPDGRQMVRFHSVFVDLAHVLEGQIIQDSVHDYRVIVSTSTKLTDQEKKILTNRVQSQLGRVKVTIIEVKEIPRGNNGKFKAVISKLDKTHVAK